MVPFIGLTGGIGAGKSAALDALQRLGAAVLSTDAVVHELYNCPEVKKAVAGRFGQSVLQGGSIDRAQLANRAFAAPDDRAWLEGLLWPRVAARMLAWREQLEHAAVPPRAAVVEVPLLFEAEMENAFDATIAVVADEDLRTERAAERGHKALDERSARQLPQHEKAARATYVVVNDGTLDELGYQLAAIVDMLHR